MTDKIDFGDVASVFDHLDNLTSDFGVIDKEENKDIDKEGGGR